MPDISMCFAKFGCDKKNKCYRFRAKPDYYQAYADFKPNEDGVCKYFIKFIENKKSE